MHDTAATSAAEPASTAAARERDADSGGAATRLLVEGWRGVSHSFALVNQCQLLQLLQQPRVQLFHRDMPFAMKHWKAAELDAGFAAADQARIAALAEPKAGDAVDAVYRICAPYRTGAHCAEERGGAVPAITFMVTEIGLTLSSFAGAPGDGARTEAFTHGANCIVTPSHWSRERLLEWGYAADKVHVVPHGVDAATFKPLHDAERAATRAALGIDSGDCVFLNLGPAMWNKGLDVLLLAYARLRQRHKNLRLVLKDQRLLYGPSLDATLGPLLREHPQAFMQDTLASISTITANLSQQQLRALYGMADCYVSPYRAEGFNLPALEAIACGTPVIVTGHGATDDFCNADVAVRIDSRAGAMDDDANPGSVMRFREPDADSLLQAMEATVLGNGIRRGAAHTAACAAVVQTMNWRAPALQLLALARRGGSAAGVDGSGNFAAAAPAAKAPRAAPAGDATPVAPAAHDTPAAAAEPQRQQASAGRPRAAAAARRLLIYCDGGFGNRFNALVSGLALAESTGLAPLVVWPVNNWCGAAFADLFDNPLPVVDRELATFAAERDNHLHFIHEDALKLAETWVSPMALTDWAAVRALFAGSSRDVFYYTALIPPFVDAAARTAVIRSLQFRHPIAQRAHDFMQQHRLGEQPGDFVGIQIRKTDFGANGADDDSLFAQVSRLPQRRFFVCSDDAAVERRFAALPQVAVHAKRAYVERRVDGGWNALNADHSGRVYPCNVQRNAESVQDAVVDLLVLSKSQIVKTSHSTFLNTALLLQSAAAA